VHNLPRPRSTSAKRRVGRTGGHSDNQNLKNFGKSRGPGPIRAQKSGSFYKGRISLESERLNHGSHIDTCNIPMRCDAKPVRCDAKPVRYPMSKKHNNFVDQCELERPLGDVHCRLKAGSSSYVESKGELS
jgi:hypothetical protein